MTLKTTIIGFDGEGHKAAVTKDNNLRVKTNNIPEFGIVNDYVLFSQYISSDGTSDGSEDLRVNGSVTPVDFWIQAVRNEDIVIRTLSIEIIDASATLSKFGNLVALTNGIEIIYEDALGERVLEDSIIRNWDFNRFAGNYEFSSNVIGGAEAF